MKLKEIKKSNLIFMDEAPENEIKKIIHQLQEIFVNNAPSIPLFAEASWAECNTTHFTNFPSQENPYGTLSPNYEHENLFLMLNVRPR